MRNGNILESFNNAIEGFIYVVKTQRNMRIHFMLSALVILFGIYLNLPKIELLLLGASIGFVLFSEMFNTAIEEMVDLFTEEAHPVARIVKDISAGAVLVASITAFIVGYILFIERFSYYLEHGVTFIKQSSWHISLIALVLVIFFVVFGKAFFHKGRPLQGGMPSGHAAVAFSIWMVTVFLSDSYLLITLVFVMAYLIAQSRVRRAIHNVWEVMAGSLLGIFTTMMVFGLLR